MTQLKVGRFAIWLVTFGIYLIPATSLHAQLIVNGSFETPVVPVGGFTNFLGGSAAITGWTVVGVDTSIASTSFMQSGITFNAQSGNQWADMAGVTSNSNSSGVTQSVTTTSGLAYQLSFYVGSAKDNVFFFPATVDLSINGGARMSFTNPAAPTDHLDWKLFSVNFTATGPSTNITFFNGSAANNFISPLDNVSLVVAVPEPSAFLLIFLATAIGVAALGFRRYRRRFGKLSASNARS
ncbi:MAG: DUF642 domain-containing protein [Gemmatales bacterium]